MGKRKKKSSPGVVLLRPSKAGRTRWRARFVDPDSDRRTWVTLDSDLTTRDMREDWAARKSKALGKRRREIEEGAVRKSGTSLGDAEDAFYASLRIRPRTRSTYRDGTSRFLAWAPKHGVKTCDDLTVGKLMAFRTALNSEAQTAFTFNKWLRPCKQMWKHWIRSQYCPRLNRGDLEDIELQEAKAKRRNFLNPAQIRKLLASTERHDLENLPIGPFVLFILLTGMRRGEGVSLAWDEVDFQAINSSGDAVGRIYLPGAKTKTKKERDVFLDVSPAVFQLLRVLRQRTGGAGFVFGLTTHQVDSAMKRLRAHYGAPKAFDYQTLRRTASTFLGNAHGVPNGGPYAASEQLGHSLEIMKRFYTGRVKVSPDCTSLESAMGVEDIAARIAGSSTFSKKRTFQS